MNDYELRDFAANKINTILKSNGLAQKTVSGLIGHGENVLTRIIKKQHTPSLTVISDFCDYFGITLSEFFEEDYSEDKTIPDLINLLKRNYSEDDIDKVYSFFQNLGSDRIQTLISLFDDYNGNQIPVKKQGKPGKEKK